MDTDSSTAFEEHCLSPASYCHLTGAITEFCKSNSIYVLIEWLLDGKEHDKTTELNNNELTNSLSLAVNCVFWSEAVLCFLSLCIRVVNLAEALHIGEEGKSINRRRLYDSKDKTPYFQWWKWCNTINLTPGLWLITLENSAISKTLCLSLALYHTLSRQIRLSEWKSMFLSSHLISISAAMKNWFVSLLHNDRVGWGKRWWLLLWLVHCINLRSLEV